MKTAGIEYRGILNRLVFWPGNQLAKTPFGFIRPTVFHELHYIRELLIKRRTRGILGQGVDGHHPHRYEGSQHTGKREAEASGHRKEIAFNTAPALRNPRFRRRESLRPIVFLAVACGVSRRPLLPRRSRPQAASCASAGISPFRGFRLQSPAESAPPGAA